MGYITFGLSMATAKPSFAQEAHKTGTTILSKLLPLCETRRPQEVPDLRG